MPIFDKTENIIIRDCLVCKTTHQVDISNREVRWLEEYQEWENLAVECSCGAVEFFNMNLPADEKTYDELPYKEALTRLAVQEIITEKTAPEITA